MPRWPEKTPLTDPGSGDLQKELRLKLVLYTGVKTLIRELEGDLAEIMGHESQPHARKNGNTLPRLELPAPDDHKDTKAGTRALTRAEVEAKKLRSQKMKDVWALRRKLGLGKSGKIPKEVVEPFAGVTVAQPPEVIPVTDYVANVTLGPAKRGRPVKKKAAPKDRRYYPIIGYATNTAFLYEYAVAHNNELVVNEVRAAAEKYGHRLGTGTKGKVTVAIAEAMNKGFFTHTGQPGTYRLTGKAMAVYTKERKQALKGNHTNV